MLRLCPERVIDSDWLKWKGYKVDWDNPRDINEKIQWLMFRSDTTLWSLYSDKYRVREYVKSKGLEDILVPLLGVWNKAEDIDFESLPQKFVIKCNHDSGSTIIIDKSKGLDQARIRSELNRHLKVKYGFEHGEMYYNPIKPLIIAEKFLEPEDSSISDSPVDYKVWCFGGEPKWIMCCSNRTEDSLELSVYDLDWKYYPEHVVSNDHYIHPANPLPRPMELGMILSYAAKLSEGFPEVRVDFYETGGKVYFGEMTFASLCGKMNYYSDSFLEELGRECVLPDRIFPKTSATNARSPFVKTKK